MKSAARMGASLVARGPRPAAPPASPPPAMRLLLHIEDRHVDVVVGDALFLEPRPGASHIGTAVDAVEDGVGHRILPQKSYAALAHTAVSWKTPPPLGRPGSAEISTLMPRPSS